jgi:hypothetical protein
MQGRAWRVYQMCSGIECTFFLLSYTISFFRSSKSKSLFVGILERTGMAGVPCQKRPSRALRASTLHTGPGLDAS